MAKQADGTLDLNQLDLVTSILGLVDKQAKAKGIKGFGARPDQLNAVIKAADVVVEAFAEPTRAAQPNCGVDLWLKSHDTGTSSLAMCRHLTGKGYASDPKAHPIDPDDFGRCYRFLRAVPEATAKLPLMADVSLTWSRMIAEWPRMEHLYERDLASGRSDELYELMQSLRSEPAPV